jgi:WD40 repeat protein
MQILSIDKKERIHALAFSPSGQDIAAACGDGQLRIWDRATAKVRQSCSFVVPALGYDITYLDENRLAFAGNYLGWLDIPNNSWNVIGGWALLPVHRICASPHGHYLVKVDRTNTTERIALGLIAYETATWQSVPILHDPRHCTGGAAFSTDGRWLATGHIVKVGEKQRITNLVLPIAAPVPSYDHLVVVRDTATGHVVHTVAGWKSPGVGHLTFSHDRKILAGASGSRLRIWDLDVGRELALHKRGPKHFQGLSFTADGRYLATVSNDTTVRIWDARTWQEHTTFTWDVGALLNIAMAPDGCVAAAGSDKGKIVIWDVDG